jgi:hypothetical protein
MNDLAMQYEWLIRRAFQVSRFGVTGANTDTYRALEQSFISFRDNKNPNEKDELLFNYAFQCGKVAGYITGAIERFANDFESTLNEEQNQEIDHIEMLLINSRIEQIEEAIQRAEALMIALGRSPQ